MSLILVHCSHSWNTIKFIFSLQPVLYQQGPMPVSMPVPNQAYAQQIAAAGKGQAGQIVVLQPPSAVSQTESRIEASLSGRLFQ